MLGARRCCSRGAGDIGTLFWWCWGCKDFALVVLGPNGHIAMEVLDKWRCWFWRCWKHRGIALGVTDTEMLLWK